MPFNTLFIIALVGRPAVLLVLAKYTDSGIDLSPVRFATDDRLLVLAAYMCHG